MKNKSQLEFNWKPKEGLEILYWVLETYAIAGMPEQQAIIKNNYAKIGENLWD